MSAMLALKRVIADMHVFVRASAPLGVSSVWPTSGPTNGLTAVTVYGSNFVGSLPLLCSFGTKVGSVATWNSESRLVCLSPGDVAGAVSVEVSNNNQEYTAHGVTFAYQAAINVSGVSVANGPEGTACTSKQTWHAPMCAHMYAGVVCVVFK